MANIHVVILTKNGGEVPLLTSPKMVAVHVVTLIKDGSEVICPLSLTLAKMTPAHILYGTDKCSVFPEQFQSKVRSLTDIKPYPNSKKHIQDVENSGFKTR